MIILSAAAVTAADDNSTDEDTTGDEEIDLDITYDVDDDTDNEDNSSDEGKSDNDVTVSLEKHATANPILLVLAVLVSSIFPLMRRK